LNEFWVERLAQGYKAFLYLFSFLFALHVLPCSGECWCYAVGPDFCGCGMVFAIAAQLCSLAPLCMGAIAILVLKQHSA
jgi:hypothetical protein